MTKDEALKLALEALGELVAQTEGRLFAVKHDHFALQNAREAITAIKEALAQPDAFEQGRQEGMKQERALWTLSKLGQKIEAQPAQRPWVELTDEEIALVNADYPHPQGFARAIEAKLKAVNGFLKDKNT